jgi:hypothetical protein
VVDGDAIEPPTFTEPARLSDDLRDRHLQLPGPSGPLSRADAPAVGEPEAFYVKGAQVPFMITQSQKEALRNKGFDDNQISNMTPATAHRLLGVK